MKKRIVMFVLCIVLIGAVFATDFSSGVGLSFYGSKNEKLSRQKGLTATVNYNFYSPWSAVDVLASISASYGKYGYFTELDGFDGFHANLMVGGKFKLSGNAALKVGAGAAASFQLMDERVRYNSSGKLETRYFVDVKFGPSGYLMLDFYTGSSLIIKIGSVFGMYLGGRVMDENFDWNSAKKYTRNEFFIWPQIAFGYKL